MAKVRTQAKGMEPRRGAARVLWMAAGALVLACALIYAQTATYGFINLDDPLTVVQNAQVNKGWSWAGVRWAFVTFNYVYWQPLTWLSHMTDCQLFGLNPGRHHLTNVALHMANAVLLLFGLWRMTGSVWRSVIAAALFALHPLRVESVAWITERKDVLSGFFWILTLILYSADVRKPSRWGKVWVALSLACGLMSKPSVVTLPFVLLLLDRWPLGRREGWFVLIREKAVLFAMSMAVSAATFWGQQEIGATVAMERLPLYFRLENATLSYVKYLGKFFWPADLAVMYPLGKIPVYVFLAALGVLGGVSWLAWRERVKRGYLWMGWLWFLGAMVPMIGLAQVGVQAMADRFTYLPGIGLSIAVAWGCAELLVRLRVPLPVQAGVAGLTFGVLSFASLVQTSYWKDSFTLFERTVVVAPGNDMIHVNLGEMYENSGQLEPAKRHFVAASKIEPRNFGVQIMAARVLLKIGDHQAAAGHLEKATQLMPGDMQVVRMLAESYIGMGRKREAKEMLQRVLKRYPSDLIARAQLMTLEAEELQRR